MKLQNAHIVQDFKVPNFFVFKTTITTDGEIKQMEEDMFHLAMILVNAEIEISPPTIPLLDLNVYFMENSEMTFILDEDVVGCFHRAVIFPVGRWRKWGLRQAGMLYTMIEELSHAVWQIPDGPQVELKVREVFQQIPSTLSVEDLLQDAYDQLNQISSVRSI